jgi:two-component system, LytTR family, sensor kinase
MQDLLSIHEPVLVNTIGHCAGVLIFGLLVYLFLVNRWRTSEERSALPVVASVLALLWNLGSLIGLAIGPGGGAAADWVAAGSFAVLSVLPAVLLHISLESRERFLWISGYVLSAAAAALHLSEFVLPASQAHSAALLIVTVGFSALTLISVVLALRRANRGAGSRLAGAMGLFLFAISFAHFGAGHSALPWSREIALHHAGLPLALLVLLQDYRFLLLDAFLRFIVNASLAAGAVLLAIRALESFRVNEYAGRPFSAGLLFVTACVLLALFVYVRNRTQSLLTRVLFLRSNIDEVTRGLENLARTSQSEIDYLNGAAGLIARFLRTSRHELTTQRPVEDSPFASPVTVVNRGAPAWTQAILPMRFARGDAAYLLLGPRDGGRRYLSEDLAVLARLGTTLVEQIEQLRSLQLQNLVAQAELRALQAQINPHFLFNALNTLYGTIDRGNAEARRLVLNLADVFRYLLQAERTFVDVEQEVKIVRSYLAIEELRLGPKLRTEVHVDKAVLGSQIPLLSIQPLVENAVRHGVAKRLESGFVRLTVTDCVDGVLVEVVNSGECDPQALALSNGIGLTNVRRRLALCYGPDAGLHVRSEHGVTTVSFRLPVKALTDAMAVIA